jgi:hypothetical protein
MLADAHMSDNTSPTLQYAARARSAHAVSSLEDVMVPIGRGAGLIVASLLSLGLWGTILLALSSFARSW